MRGNGVEAYKIKIYSLKTLKKEVKFDANIVMYDFTINGTNVMTVQDIKKEPQKVEMSKKTIKKFMKTRSINAKKTII